jgi:Trk K+ transport system NAD-binding subunit
VIDPTEAGAEAAGDDGLAVVVGDATRVEVLQRAEIASAEAIVVAPERDDTAVLITLTARELNPGATIVAAVREEENVHLLKQSGADSVITSSSAAGRLLGLATHRPRVVEVLEDMITVGHGLDIIEREITPAEAGPLRDLHESAPVMAVVRGDEILRFDDPRAADLVAGDRIVTLASHRELGVADPDHVSGVQLAPAPRLGLAVDGDVRLGQEALDVAPRGDDPGQLEQLPEPDHVAADGDLGHASNLAGTPNWKTDFTEIQEIKPWREVALRNGRVFPGSCVPPLAIPTP